MQIKVLDRDLYAKELEDGFVPKRSGDAGIDLRAVEDTEIGHRQTAKIPLGVAIEIPSNTVATVAGRSSSTLAFGILTHEGKIDSGYRGEIHWIGTALERSCKILRGERIAQLIVAVIVPPVDGSLVEGGWEITDHLNSSERGEFGLGSTGRQ